MTYTYMNIISYQQYMHPDLSYDLLIDMPVIHAMSNCALCKNPSQYNI